MAQARSWRDHGDIDGRSWETRSAAALLKRKSDAFQPLHAAELINAMRGHRLSQGYGQGADWFYEDGSFAPNAHLDTSMIDDRRWRDPFPWDARVERPAPKGKVRPRNGKAGSKGPDWPTKPGRHDADNPLSEALKNVLVPTRPKVKIKSKGAFAGDGRLERPAPHGPEEQYVGKGAAGSRHSRRVIATRPGEILPSTRPKKKVSPKTKPTINQGRHDG